jgi:hypothetical protein
MDWTIASVHFSRASKSGEAEVYPKHARHIAASVTRRDCDAAQFNVKQKPLYVLPVNPRQPIWRFSSIRKVMQQDHQLHDYRRLYLPPVSGFCTITSFVD